jgi:hypothetical protein
MLYIVHMSTVFIEVDKLLLQDANIGNVTL